MALVEMEIPDYHPEKGFNYKWENGFNIKTQIEEGVIRITVNKAGLFSLANHLLNLAQDSLPSGCHLHFDEFNALEEGSVELIIEKMTI